MVGCKPVLTPAVDGMLGLEDIEPLKGEEITKFKKAMGIAIDRADIMYVVTELGRWQREPLEAHTQAMKRLARFLAGMLDYAVEITRPKGHDTLVTTDANWAGCRKNETKLVALGHPCR